MLKNYIKIALRNMLRNKLFTSINILGLSVSIACCLLLFLYVSAQFSYDKHHGDNVFRLTGLLTQDNGNDIQAQASSVPFGPAMNSQIPEVEAAARLIQTSVFGKDAITKDGQSFFIDNGAVADSLLFDVLKFDIVAGDPRNLLPNGNSVVLETAWAIKVFGSEQVIGEQVTISTGLGTSEYTVTGVYDKNGYDAHISPSFIISTSNTDWAAFIARLSDQWLTNNLAITYAKLNSESKKSSVENKVNQIFEENGAEAIKEYGMTKVMSLQPVTDIHINRGDGLGSDGSVSLVFLQVLVGVGVLILVLACVNYINLSTAQASNRALEVGVRKVMGISSKGLIIQFLGESLILIFISLLLSILLAELSLPFFNQLVSDPVSLNTDSLVQLMPYMLGFLIITTFLAGIYPSTYLASFKPSSVLKGKNKDKSAAVFLRKILVTSQFVISVVLISSILVISDQVEFIKNTDLGFDSSSRMVLTLSNDVQERFPAIRDKFKGLANVKSVGGGSYVPGSHIFSDLAVYKSGQTPEEALYLFRNDVDADYLKALNLKILAGQDFDKISLQDSTIEHVIINRLACERLGFEPQSAVGEPLFFNWSGETYTFKIEGVMENINQQSLHKSIDPMVYRLNEDAAFPNLIVETSLESHKETISLLEKTWKEIAPEVPFEAIALDDHLAKQYEDDIKMLDLIKYFTIISVLISCMGLYALSMYTAERRFKEIGVRKVLGANIKDILVLVSKDLSLLILIAFVLSIPISIYVMNKWLSSFAYHVEQGAWTYIWAGFITVLIAWFTISYQSIRAARTNPVDVLKDE